MARHGQPNSKVARHGQQNSKLARHGHHRKMSVPYSNSTYIRDKIITPVYSNYNIFIFNRASLIKWKLKVSRKSLKLTRRIQNCNEKNKQTLALKTRLFWNCNFQILKVLRYIMLKR